MHSVYFARHGETVWNVEDKICGMTDSPLTEKGRRRPPHWASRSRPAEPPSTRFCILPSPAPPTPALAVAAAPPARPAGAPPAGAALCGYEGTSPRNSPDFTASKMQFADHYGGGESMLQLAQRIYNLLDELRADETKTYLLVAHNGIARWCSLISAI